jgi:hypothetical protein
MVPPLRGQQMEAAMPRTITAEFIGEQLWKVFPDGKTVPYPDALVEAEKLGFRKVVESMAFGAPDSITRKGNNFTALGKKPDSTTQQGITVYSEAKVTFTAQRSRGKLFIMNIEGVKVSPWELKSFKLREVTITDNGAGDLYLFTWAYLVFPVKVKIDQKTGKVNRQ